MAKTVAEARRTQVVSTYGVGSLFPAEDESFMIVGIDDWDEELCPVVAEPRLARSLDVHVFRMPPARGKGNKDLPVVRFPRIHHCPSCSRLDTLKAFCGWNDNTCDTCQRTLTPSRFVVCCESGHIQEFPYLQWTHKGQMGGDSSSHNLTLKTRGKTSSLSDLVVRCSCGATRSMAGAFSPGALIGITSCSGQRPWLRGTPSDSCDKKPRTLQRGSSNVWFASVKSAISIPPWSEGVHQVIAPLWKILQHVPIPALEATLVGIGLPASSGYSVADLIATIIELHGDVEGEAPTQSDLRSQEYLALVAGRPELSPQQQFVCNPVVGLPAAAALVLTQVSEVARLREVRALVGFTRVLPGGEDDETRIAPLSAQHPTWLPAIEVLGEGVFVTLPEERLAVWETTPFAVSRTASINKAFEERARQLGSTQSVEVTPRDVLVHTFAHALLTELSMDAGYPVASLRERVFSAADQTGILIYTASADSAGSLGGLSAQSAPHRIWAVARSAIRRSSWCSSDPVCIESVGAGVDALNLSACHACILLPETSCERMNTVLDRAMLVGTPGQPDAGFFSSLLLG